MRLIDQDGAPVAGASVRAFVYWSQHNHCAVLAQTHLLGEGVSDRKGRVTIPDAELEYAFLIEKPHHALAEPQLPEYPERLVTTFQARELEVRLRRFSRRSVDVRFGRTGKPAADLVLTGCRSGCPGGICAACCGPLGRTDAGGRLSIEDFYPEEWESVALESPEGSPVWHSTAEALVRDGGSIELEPR